MSDLYHEHLLERYKEPSCKGQLSHPTHKHELVNSSCGDEVTIELTLAADGTVIDAAWSGSGCSISQVAADILCERMIENHLSEKEVFSLQLENIAEWLELPVVAPGRIKCMSLGLVATQRALETATEK